MRYWELKGWFSFVCWYCAFFLFFFPHIFVFVDLIKYAAPMHVIYSFESSFNTLYFSLFWLAEQRWNHDKMTSYVLETVSCVSFSKRYVSYDIVESSWNLRPTFFKLVNGNLSKFLHSKTALITFNSLLRFRCELIPRIYLCSWRLKTFFVEHVRKLHIHRESRKLERWKVFL